MVERAQGSSKKKGTEIGNGYRSRGRVKGELSSGMGTEARKESTYSNTMDTIPEVTALEQLRLVVVVHFSVESV